MNLVLHPFHDASSCSFSYVVANPASGSCAIIDPVLGYDPATGRFDTREADRMVELVNANGYVVEWILETQVHADRLSAAAYLKQQFVCAQTGISAHVTTVQARLATRTGLDLATDGRQFDRLFNDQDRVCIGHVCGRVIHTPGHTPACVTYLFDGMAFVGDALGMPDTGTACCDFPGGDAATLYQSVRRILDLPDDTRLFTAHDHTPPGRDRRFASTVAEQRARNVEVHDGVTERDFVAVHDQRAAPPVDKRMRLAAVCGNLDGGVLPGWQMPLDAVQEYFPQAFTR